MALGLQVNCEDLMQFKLKRRLLKQKFTLMFHGRALSLREKFNFLTVP